MQARGQLDKTMESDPQYWIYSVKFTRSSTVDKERLAVPRTSSSIHKHGLTSTSSGNKLTKSDRHSCLRKYSHNWSNINIRPGCRVCLSLSIWIFTIYQTGQKNMVFYEGGDGRGLMFWLWFPVQKPGYCILISYFMALTWKTATWDGEMGYCCWLFPSV